MRVERARYAEAALRLGSLRAAAEEVGVSQPTLRQQLELFEEELDTVLLTRSRRGVVGTPAGEELLPWIRQLIAAEDALRDGALGLTGAYQGTVRVGCVPSLASVLLAPVIGRLLSEHPRLRFTVAESTSGAVEDLVADGGLDFGVVTEPSTPPMQRLERRRLFSFPLYACAPSDHPLARRRSLTWSELASWPLVSMRRGTRLWEMLHTHLAEPRVVFEASTAQTLRMMVAHGAGIGVDTLIASGIDDARLVHVPLTGPEPEVEVCLTQRTNSQPSSAALTVRALLLEQAELVYPPRLKERGHGV
ncbi:LysR family cyn operon transcriptional activator [Tamaricihabitans halophyticus]|uniref:LysR family cyn operon transcriptional activator n=1 Tax=Tamaricihabitans halophyticus TaxID=1262583 RepID=A0A4R2R4J8_9PSEU|nr:LysR family transcriptional regulator [Tamaricihabitans halophyticus]TCP57503.1 LysR family cyn operon transcriptional activator [Tamaricihabitans halophyticus]